MKTNLENMENKTEQAIPTREEMMESLKKVIEISELRLRIQEINMFMATYRANELEAFTKIEHFTKKPGQGTDEEIIEHTVTQTDIDNNPELGKQGIKVGQKIGIPRSAIVDSDTPEVKEKDEEIKSTMKVVK